MTRTLESALHHRSFAAPLRPSTDAATLAAGRVRAEIRALVTRGALARRDGPDLLARLGPQVLLYRRAVAVPVSVTTTAPNDRYASRPASGNSWPRPAGCALATSPSRAR